MSYPRDLLHVDNNVPSRVLKTQPVAAVYTFLSRDSNYVSEAEYRLERLWRL